MAKKDNNTKVTEAKATEAKPTKNAGPATPPLTISAQYIKDLSFEHPNPMQALQNSTAQPEIDINIDVGAENVKENTFEVSLHVKANAKRGDDTLFISEVVYAGIFSLGEAVPKEAVHPVLMIECPRMLFPFARAILANITREGGFPPLSLNPIDFAALYQQQMEAAAKEKKA